MYEAIATPTSFRRMPESKERQVNRYPFPVNRPGVLRTKGGGDRHAKGANNAANREMTLSSNSGCSSLKCSG